MTMPMITGISIIPRMITSMRAFGDVSSPETFLTYFSGTSKRSNAFLLLRSEIMRLFVTVRFAVVLTLDLLMP